MKKVFNGFKYETYMALTNKHLASGLYGGEYLDNLGRVAQLCNGLTIETCNEMGFHFIEDDNYFDEVEAKGEKQC